VMCASGLTIPAAAFVAAIALVLPAALVRL
jgi:hypothetical protein